MNENAKIDPPTKVAGTTLSTGSVPSCLRNDNGTCKKKSLPRRVSFPDDDQQIVTGFMEPPNPWEYDSVDKEELESIYILSCKKHGARPLSPVLNQIQNLDFDVERNECFNLKGERLGPAECETLEEVLKRVQFDTINLEATYLDDEASVAMFDMMEYYESTVHLNIAGNHNIGVRGWQACSHLVKRTKCLEELDARNTTLNEQYMPILCRALRLSPQLHVLKLENCNLSGRPIIILAAALKLNTVLKELYLGENYLSANDAAQLSALIKVNSTLQLLDISNNNIQDAGLGHLGEGLSEQNNAASGLAVLVVWNNHLTRNSSSHLAKVLTNSKTLEMLNVGQNVLSNEVLHTTKDALQKNKTLLRLGMQSTHLTCEGAVALAEIIADNSVIQRIDLRDNNLQVAGLMALALSMKVNMNVTQLDLDDTPRRKHSMGASLDEYVRLVAEIRSFCQRNESLVVKTEEKSDVDVVTETEPITTPERRSRLGSFASRKISLTCETLMRNVTTPTPEPVVQHLTEPKRSGGRLRSPAPSPIPSPVASPSPTRSRFQVSRVSESESPVTPPSTTNTFFNSGSSSRFKVTVVDYPPVNSAPVPVIAGNNNVTIGFETPTLTLSPTPAQISSSAVTSESSPSQNSPTVPPFSCSPPTSTSSSSVCTVASSYQTIPLLFPTPMPSPITSPVPSPSSVPSEHSPLKENIINDPFTSSASLPSKTTLSDPDCSLDNKNNLDISSSNIVHLSNVVVDDNTATKIQTDLTDSKTHPTTDLDHSALVDNKVHSDVSSSHAKSLSSFFSGSFSKEKKCRSDSEESEKDVLLTKSKLPKATDSLDLSAFHILKQPSISVAEKPTQRSRKISWVQPSSMFSAVTSQDDTSKPPSSLERLLSLFNPFSRQKTEEEPQLQSVPELSEKPSQENNSSVISASEPKHFSVTNTVDKIVQSISEMSVSSCLANVNNQLEISAEKQTNCEQDSCNFNVLKPVADESNLKSDLKVNNCIVTCTPTILENSSAEAESEVKSANIPDNLNNNETCFETYASEIKCETWPQGRTGLEKLNVIHQSQSKSAPCLAALVLLQSNVTSDISVDIKKLSPPQNDDTMDAAKNITWAL